MPEGRERLDQIAAASRPSLGEPIRVVVAADVRLYREGLAVTLQRNGAVDVVATAEDAGGVVSSTDEFRPDVVLLDIGMPDALSAVHELAAAAPDVHVVALGVQAAELSVVAWAEAGVAGYVMRDESIDALVAAVESVVRDEVICTPHTARILLRRVATLAAERGHTPVAAPLTVRELEIGALLEQGLSNKQIAQRLSIEVATVKNHVHSIFEKLQVHRRADAAARLRAGGTGLRDVVETPG